MVSSQVTVTEGVFPDEVSWNLTCTGPSGEVDSFTGGAPYSAPHEVPHGSTCTLISFKRQYPGNTSTVDLVLFAEISVRSSHLALLGPGSQVKG